MEQKSTNKIILIVLLTIFTLFACLVISLLILYQNGFFRNDVSMNAIPTEVPKITDMIIPTPSPEYIAFEFSYNYFSEYNEADVVLEITSLLPNEYVVEPTIPMQYDNNIRIFSKEFTFELSFNPYDAGGFWTANDYDLTLVDNKLNRFLLRAQDQENVYTYADFYQGKCLQETQEIITPVPPELYCGSPLINIENLEENLSETIFLTCRTTNPKGLEQCDRFVENLTIDLTKSERI